MLLHKKYFSNILEKSVSLLKKKGIIFCEFVYLDIIELYDFHIFDL